MTTCAKVTRSHFENVDILSNQATKQLAKNFVGSVNIFCFQKLGIGSRCTTFSKIIKLVWLIRWIKLFFCNQKNNKNKKQKNNFNLKIKRMNAQKKAVFKWSSQGFKRWLWIVFNGGLQYCWWYSKFKKVRELLYKAGAMEDRENKPLPEIKKVERTFETFNKNKLN